MRINEADVAELVDARDLKSLVDQPQALDITQDFKMSACKTLAEKPADLALKPVDLQNNSGAKIPINRVSARGKKYAYIRGTDIALVRGFSGSNADFDLAIQRGIADYLDRGQIHVAKMRDAAAFSLHKTTLNRARTKGRFYALSPEIIRQLLGQSQDRCALTDLQFDYNERVEGDEWMRRPLSPSIDRLDNRRGYELDNVRVICTSLNIAINEWGLETFEQVCRAFLKGKQP